MHIRLTGKRVVDFLLALIEHFSLREALYIYIRAKIDRKSAICEVVGQHKPNFRAEMDVPHKSFLQEYLGQ